MSGEKSANGYESLWLTWSKSKAIPSLRFQGEIFNCQGERNNRLRWHWLSWLPQSEQEEESQRNTSKSIQVNACLEKNVSDFEFFSFEIWFQNWTHMC